MRKTLGLLVIFYAGLLCSYAQKPALQLHTNNFYTFSSNEKVNSNDIADYTSPNFFRHPEFKINPLYTPCSNCFELLQKRDLYSRVYVESGSKAKHTYTQQSYLPMNYDDGHGWICSIDPRLKKVDELHFSASQQPVKTSYDAITHSISIIAQGAKLRFGDQMKVYYETDRKQQIPYSNSNGNYQVFTAGDDGVQIKEVFPGLDIQHIFGRGSVKSNYIITKQPNVPENVHWLVVEEKLSLPPGLSLHRSWNEGEEDSNHYWNGDLSIIDAKNHEIFTWNKPVYFDSRNYMVRGYYDVKQDGNNYTLRLMVPVWWLGYEGNEYPLYIDPFVYGRDSIGHFSADHSSSAGLKYTYYLTGSCDYHLTVRVPGMSDIVNCYVDLEYVTTTSVTCGRPPLPAPGCKKLDITEEVISDECGTTSGPLSCSPPPSGVDTPGTCTTDPRLVPGARAIPLATMLDCIPPQCPDYFLHFTLKNREKKCHDSCGTNCATGTFWAMTVEARTLEGYILPNKDTVCAGEPIILRAYPSWGVPPYHYRWSTGDTTRNITVTPNVSAFYSCRIYDTCGNFVDDDTLLVVKPSPPADAGPDITLCEGGSTLVGGAPTGPFSASYLWSCFPSAGTAYLASLVQANPGVNIPIGTVDTFSYVVKVIDAVCYRYDTMRVFCLPNPHPKLSPDSGTFICSGGEVTFHLDKPFTGYTWSDGSTGSLLTVTQAGSYSVSVVDEHGCVGHSDTVSLGIKPLPTFHAYPDTSIDPENSVHLYSDVNLAAVDSFYWDPPSYLNCDACLNATSTPEDDIWYHLHVQIDGCWNEDSVLIKVNYPFDFFVPDAFTPNGDGYNDAFYINSSKVLHVTRFMIFDRWGEKLWDATEPWTGIYKGSLLNPGVYVYFVQVEYKGRKKVGKGSVTLLR